MKKSLLLIPAFILCVLGFSNQVSAQDYDNIVKLNPLSLGFRTLNLSYERVIGEKSTVQMGVFYTNATQGGNGFTGFGLTPEFRYYLGAKGAGSGFYIAPYARYWNLGVKSSETDVTTGIAAEVKANVSMLSGGVNIGTQATIGNRIKIDFFFGPQYFAALSASASASATAGGETANSSASDSGFLGGGFWVRGGINVGFAF